MGKKKTQDLYIIVHYHRFGDSTLPVYASKKPTNKQVEKYLGDDYEAGRDDEGYEVHGPYDTIDTL